MTAAALKMAIGDYGHTKALKDGSVKPPGVELEQIEVSPIIGAFRRMVRGLEFDISEMAITTYLCARAFNKPFTAIPVFPVRAFHHGAIVYNTKSGIKAPSDLEGRRVGLRGYTVTTGAWIRGILGSEYGVDLSKVTWVLAGDEHVAEYQAPSNVVSAPEGKELPDMLLSGEIDAAIGVGNVDSPDVKPLISDARAAEAAYFQKTGVYPINHTVVIKNEVLAANPDIAQELFVAFKEAKQPYLERLSQGGELPPRDQALANTAKMMGGDPLPYGVGPNQKALEAIIQYAVDQKIIPQKAALEELFVASTLRLE
jgi:4,5-dihydroxyphthalate decarboxylase